MTSHEGELFVWLIEVSYKRYPRWGSVSIVPECKAHRKELTLA